MSKAISIRKVNEAIAPTSFEACMSAIADNLRLLNVPVGDTDMNSLIVAWARHIAEDAEFSMDVFNLAYKGVNTAQDASQAVKIHSNLHAKLTGSGRSWIDFLLFRPDNSAIVSAITSHPFYEEFQREGLVAAAGAVDETWKTFSEIDKKVTGVVPKLGTIQDNLSKIKEPNTNLDDVLAAGANSHALIKTSLGKTMDVLKARKPELYNSTFSISALADIAARELYGSWAQSLALLDTALSRYYMLAYVGIMMDTAIKLKLAGQTVKLMNEGTNIQVSEMIMLVDNLVHS